MVVSLRSPYPWFGGPDSPHIFAITEAFIFRVARGNSHRNVALLALALESVRGPLVAIKLGLRFDYLAGSALLGGLLGAATIGIFSVLGVRVPPEVVRSVVVLVRVWVMAAFHTSWFWSNKSFEYKSMDCSGNGSPIHAQRHEAVAASAFVDGQFSRWPRLPGRTGISTLTFRCPDDAVFVDKIARKSRDRFHN